jgi:uncharacterized protein (TIGR02646 family)
MLKISKIYQFTKKEWQHVSKVLIPYVRDKGGIKGWEKSDNATKDLKNKISKFTLIQQNCRCVYCGSLISRGAQLDHFVPKQLHPEFCYEPKNLLTSCAVCNMYIKNSEDTIVLPIKRRYEQNQFTIVHPYFNDPNIHIKYTNEDKVIIDLNRCTYIGRKTVDFFHLNDYPAYVERAKELVDREKYPIDLIRLAEECSTYKRNKKV